MKIKANCVFHEKEITSIPVVNPGGWFGKTWLVEVQFSNWPIQLIVEADNISDAIDELSDSEQYGNLINVEDEDLDDYPEDNRHYSGSGKVMDLDHIMVYGQEGSDTPFKCKYIAEGFPEDGIEPKDLDDYLNQE
jgi:hypothetical protein